MKKVLVFLLVLTLTLSMSLSAMAASDKSNNGNGNGKEKHASQSTVLSDEASIDAQSLDAWTVTAHNNLVKFESPLNTKGGKIVIPMQAIESRFGVEAVWDGVAQTVTISKAGIGTVVVFSIDGITSTLSEAPSVSEPTTALVTDPVTDPPSGTAVSGTVGGNVTGALIGTLEGSVTASVTDGETGAINGTFAGTVTDSTVPETPIVTNVSGTITGTLSAPTIALDAVINGIDTLVPADVTDGNAYVPFNFLAETFGLNVTLDTEGETPAEI